MYIIYVYIVIQQNNFGGEFFMQKQKKMSHEHMFRNTWLMSNNRKILTIKTDRIYLQ